jgi:hypothetical protein
MASNLRLTPQELEDLNRFLGIQCDDGTTRFSQDEGWIVENLGQPALDEVRIVLARAGGGNRIVIVLSLSDSANGFRGLEYDGNSTLSPRVFDMTIALTVLGRTTEFGDFVDDQMLRLMPTGEYQLVPDAGAH